MRNIWRDAILGVVVGDALGCPVQFYGREYRKTDPVKGMRGFGVFNVPAGSWTDDSSLTLATMDSILETGCVSVDDIAERFADWYFDGKYTPYGYAYDIGRGTAAAIEKFKRTGIPLSGSKDIHNNGNGSLMRIMPVCLYNALEMVGFERAMKCIDDASSVTHGHAIAQGACELYYFVVKEILEGEKNPRRILKNAMTFAKTTYEDYDLIDCLDVFGRVLKVDQFLALPEDEIKSTGYVVDSLEAAFGALERPITMPTVC